jgi:glycerol-3-phosphate acyltransferase PlsY
MGLAAALLLLGFLAGSIPFGALFARARGVDLRKTGSGNIGATNAARALGRPLGVLVLLCDASKAYGPVTLARHLTAADPNMEWIAAGVGLAAVLGHLFPPWLRFRGGKGVASSLGVFLALEPLAAALAATVWVALYALTRISSVGSLVATAGVTLYLVVRRAPAAHVALAGALLVLILLSHRSNLRRLWRREESKV